jgi:hypothetical protein
MRVWSRRGPTAVVAAAVLMASFGGAVRRRPPGPYKGYDMVNGASWIPYQELRVVTPPFPEYVSGHSTFSAAGAGHHHLHRLRQLRGQRDRPGGRLPDRAEDRRASRHPANEAGMSRRYGGIHFESGDMHGRGLGAAVGADAWGKAQTYIRPFNTGPL